MVSIGGGGSLRGNPLSCHREAGMVRDRERGEGATMTVTVTGIFKLTIKYQALKIVKYKTPWPCHNKRTKGSSNLDFWNNINKW